MEVTHPFLPSLKFNTWQSLTKLLDKVNQAAAALTAFVTF